MMWTTLTALAETDCSSTTGEPPTIRSGPPAGTLSALRVRNFRLFVCGQVVSNTGSWIQRIAQDWLVLSLTGSATAVGVTTALQFLPTVLFGMVGGLLADRFPKRGILLATQVGLALPAAALAVLTLADLVRPWHVQLIAFVLGLVTAVDNPARQTFVPELVGAANLRNAICINSSVFQLGGLVGPAVSGVLLGTVGAGWLFAANAISYVAPLTALRRMRTADLRIAQRTPAAHGQLRAAIDYVRSRPDVFWPTVLAGVFGLFTANLAVTLAAFAHSVFRSGPAGYGMLTTVVALGSLAGALVSARAGRLRLRTLLGLGLGLSTCYLVGSGVPGQEGLAVALFAVGALTLLLLTSTNSAVQLASHEAIRGRVMGVYLGVFVGSAALGGPLLGALDENFGARAGMLAAGVLPGLITLLIAVRLAPRPWSRAMTLPHRGRLRTRQARCGRAAA